MSKTMFFHFFSKISHKNRNYGVKESKQQSHPGQCREILLKKGIFIMTDEKDVTVVPTVRRRATVRPQEEAPVAVEAEESRVDEAAEEELKVMDAVASVEAEQTPSEEEPEAEVPDSGIPQADEEVSKEEAELNKEVETEMYQQPEMPKVPVQEETPEQRKTEKKAAVKKEKEKMLTQISMANAPRSESAHTIKGIVQASRDEKKEIYSDQGIIPLADELQFRSEGQRRREDYITLVGSKRSHSALTGTIYSISTHGGRICAVIKYGSFTVLIPSEKLLGPREEKAIAEQKEEGEKTKMRRRFATQRIGSQVDFVVEAIDEMEMIAIGDRKEAMDIKKQAWYLSNDQNGEPALKKGTKAEARVVVASRNMLFVEVFGIEYVLREHDIAYVQIPNVAAEYPVGSTVPVVFTKLERERTEAGIVIHAQVSIKEAMTDPRKREFDMIQPKDILAATVTGAVEGGIIVRLGGMGGKQDAMCQYQKKTRANGYSSDYEVPPIGRNVIVKIRKKEEFDSKKNPIYRVYGDIIRVL